MSDVKRYEAIDGLRAFAAVGIVSMHVMTNGGFILPDPVHRVIGSMGEFVYLFMAVSGFSMCCGYYDRMLSGNVSIVDFYKRRFSKAFPFFALLCLIDFASSPSLHSIFEVFANLTLCFGLLPNPTMSVVGVGWFLGLVFVFYLLFPFYCFLLANKKRAWISFAIALVYNYLCSSYFFNDAHVVAGFDYRTNILYCSVFFLLGGLIFLYRDDLSRYCKVPPLCVFVLGVIAYLAMSFSYVTTLSLLIICCAFLCAAVLYSHKKCLLNNRFVAEVSVISLEIYLSHMAVFRLIEKLLGPKLPDRSMVSFLLVLFIVLMGAAVIARIYLWLQRSYLKRLALH